MKNSDQSILIGPLANYCQSHGTAIKITKGNFSHSDWPASLCVGDGWSVRTCIHGVHVFVNCMVRCTCSVSEKLPAIITWIVDRILSYQLEAKLRKFYVSRITRNYPATYTSRHRGFLNAESHTELYLYSLDTPKETKLWHIKWRHLKALTCQLETSQSWDTQYGET